MPTRKGIYPYDYFTSFEKSDEKELSPPAVFYNTLIHEDILKMKTMNTPRRFGNLLTRSLYEIITICI